MTTVLPQFKSLRVRFLFAALLWVAASDAQVVPL